ncbi:MAG: hypothetical protein ACE5JL_09575 [Dehalococcoidia bacterium]
MPNVLSLTVPYDKVLGLPCNLCDKSDIPVASVGHEWGYEFCARCLRAMADDLDDPSVEALAYSSDD